MNETDLLRQLPRILSDRNATSLVGDDCAVLRTQLHDLLITADMLMDGVHFVEALTDVNDIACKAVNVNLSDIAAAGGQPRWLVVSLAIPRSWPTPKAAELMMAMARCAAVFDCQIAGGDTNVWNGPLVINVTAVGVPHWRGPVRRNGASEGDVVFVTGALGGSLQSGRHLRFTPRVQEARWLLDLVPIKAMMDLSDGLATDGRRMAEASAVDLVIQKENVPIHSDCSVYGSEAYIHALTDGEDFELLFCVSSSDAKVLRQQWSWPIPLSAIGFVQKGSGQLLLSHGQSIAPLDLRGYEHI